MLRRVNKWFFLLFYPLHAMLTSTKPINRLSNLYLEAGDPLGGEIPRTTSKRRERKNKYSQFSKVTEQDPLEQLLEESRLLNDELQEQKLPQRDRIEVEPPALSFSNVEMDQIDPYEPTTFGYSTLGHIIGAHGVHGRVKIRCVTDFLTGNAHLRPPKKRAPRPVVLTHVQTGSADHALIHIKGIDSREDAMTLRGSTLYKREQSEELEMATVDTGMTDEEQEEYEVSQLVGLPVFLETRVALDDNGMASGGTDDDDDGKMFVGKVRGVVFGDEMSTLPGGTGYDFLEITVGLKDVPSFRDELLLIPLVPQIVTRIEKEEVYVDPPAGLLDLTYVRQEKTRIKGFLPSTLDSDM